MRLAEFILANSERIISEWETFARSLDPDDTMDVRELRDHAKSMLLVIANDLCTPQTEREEVAKSKGQSDADEGTPDTAAQAHGTERAVSGFTVEAMVSEYRALRASVIRLWTETCGALDAADVTDLVRFSESIDQSLAESTARFAAGIEHTKETFLGILGHDLRTPLGAMVTSAQFILEVEDVATAHEMAGIIVSSGGRMNQMVDDLLDFTRSRLGDSIPVERGDVDLGQLVEDGIVEIEASRPGIEVRLEKHGDLRGQWDGARLRQVLTNLVGNAIDHGSAGKPITVTARGAAAEVALGVHNLGPLIPKADFQKIFEPMTRSASDESDPDHLGLGLYIVERVVAAHGGSVEVESSKKQGTTFTVHLPRSPGPRDVRMDDKA